jgi:RHS repeat-associated protein
VETIGGVGRAFTWSYDALYRLTDEVISGAAPVGTISYRYDAVGNRTNRTSTVSGITNQTFAYTGNDWLTTDVYDANGNTRTNGANVFFYDVENRLTNATVGGVSVSYTYNANGIRVRKSSGGVTTLYLVDDRNPTGYAQVLEELTVSGGITNLAKVYTYGLDLISQRDAASSTTLYFGYDGLGSTRYLTTTNAALVNVFAYDAFGTLIASNAAPQTDYLFTGEQRDAHLGLYYLRARYLNPGMGRFWTRDAHPENKQEPISLHRYLYASANPINNSDPSGHENLAS